MPHCLALCWFLYAALESAQGEAERELIPSLQQAFTQSVPALPAGGRAKSPQLMEGPACASTSGLKAPSQEDLDQWAKGDTEEGTKFRLTIGQTRLTLLLVMIATIKDL